jgi:hypothetical protein
LVVVAPVVLMELLPLVVEKVAIQFLAALLRLVAVVVVRLSQTT